MNNNSNERASQEQAGSNPKSGFNRRSFLVRAGAGTGAAITAQVVFSTEANANPSAGRPTLVIINQRGGADGLSICAPVNDMMYGNERGVATRILPPPSMSRRWLDGTYAMGPGGEDAGQNDWLKPYHAGHLGFVHGVGMTGQSRSHFAAMESIERGVDPTAANPGTGWAARHMMNVTSLGSLVRAFGHGNLLPEVLLGGPSTSAIADVANLAIPTPGPYAQPAGQSLVELAQDVVLRTSYLGGVVGATTYPPINRPSAEDAAQATFDTIGLFNQVDFDPTTNPSPAPYPATPFGTAMRNTAKIIKAAQSPPPGTNLCVEVIHLNIGGWDHHTFMNPLTPGGRMYDLTNQLSQAIGAFYEEFGGTTGTHDEYLMMVYTEFGRQLKENASQGTDHGTGSVMALMGKGIHPTSGGAGGSVFQNGALFGTMNPDAVETRIDIRDVFAEALVNQLGLPAGLATTVFSSTTYTPTYRGIIG